jgi:sugar phosphate isomerase/epimerase
LTPDMRKSPTGGGLEGGPMRLSVSSWSMHRAFRSGMTLPQFIEKVRDEFGVDGLEICDSHFEATDVAYLDEIRAGLADHDLTVANIPVSAGKAAEPDPAQRSSNLNAWTEWLDVAKYVGSPAMRVDSGGTEADPGTLHRIIDAYRAVLERARERKIKVLIENHGGVSGDPAALEKILGAINDPYFATCPDLGNFALEDRERGIRVMSPRAGMVHLKTYDFDAAGDETTIDVEGAIRALREAGYDGWLSIEFEGSGPEAEGVLKTKALAERVLAEIG